MGFVKTPAELERIQRALGAPRFVAGRQLTVEFLTRPATLARLLPPPLEPAERPLVSVTIGEWHSNAMGDFAGASIYLAASHEGVHGGYALAMWMDGEPAIAFGRELFGEPKKHARVSLQRDDERITASVERHGSRLISLAAVMSDDLEPAGGSRIAYNFRSRAAAGGLGLDGPAVLTRSSFTETVRRRRRGRGALELRGSVHDPLEELEVGTVLGATYSELDLAARCEPVASVPAEDYLPYHHGHCDDWLALDTSSAGVAHVG
jgi:acetoacetate decarboxylase